MNLHLDKDAFRVLIGDIHSKTGYRTDVLEKDYYVVLILKELASKQSAGLPAYFKGGTALYKALRTTNRFSEDIDLSVDSRECSRTQNDKRLEAATKQYVISRCLMVIHKFRKNSFSEEFQRFSAKSFRR